MKKYYLIIILFVASCFSIFPAFAQNIPGKGDIAIVIHGGAGYIQRPNLSPEQEKDYRAKLEEALKAGYEKLDQGASAEEAVVAAIQILEASPLFNSGVGAVLTEEGKAELDASIMNGADGSAGAVAGVSRIKSPILGAMAVKDQSPHVMMAREGAEKFAETQGLEMVDPDYFVTDKRIAQWERMKKEQLEKAEGSIKNWEDTKMGTVGAVALDRNGNIAAGTSTGGMMMKKFGRIGDSPIIGAGTFAENESCGISATGHGEFFMRNVVAYDIAAKMKYQNISLFQAANEVVIQKLKKIEGAGGIIGLDQEGNITMTFNTPGMFRGYMNKKGKPVSMIYGLED
ncbi:isoaspartyl peptidase/L-asparaginase family protein [Reichenbachiella ulvae]|uniref:Isoaspartyl peptidase/L-asparaginase n=1 Tax=Reichenbachiella ulvae TaxID=2980104 RepID=A0ABT3CXS6_9BACT|nr:isoaspartyl peptidase/L-asparaginase [Reichenbachiella ulvae]MCV9388359.1 isoaspartyl peptidase/L-asparaginase [Reichenbachiella ulvae]